MSAMCRALLEDIAMTSTMIRDMQVRWLRGADVSAPELCTLINTRRRLLESPEFGPPVTPPISHYDPTDIRRTILSIFERAARAEQSDDAKEVLN